MSERNAPSTVRTAATGRAAGTLAALLLAVLLLPVTVMAANWAAAGIVSKSVRLARRIPFPK